MKSQPSTSHPWQSLTYDLWPISSIYSNSLTAGEVDEEPAQYVTSVSLTSDLYPLFIVTARLQEKWMKSQPSTSHPWQSLTPDLWPISSIYSNSLTAGEVDEEPAQYVTSVSLTSDLYPLFIVTARLREKWMKSQHSTSHPWQSLTSDLSPLFTVTARLREKWMKSQSSTSHPWQSLTSDLSPLFTVTARLREKWMKSQSSTSHPWQSLTSDLWPISSIYSDG